MTALRIGDVEREEAASALAEHYAAGRLAHDEYLERLDALWTARTRADLGVLFRDLPSMRPAAPVGVRRRGGPPWPVMVVLVLVGALVVLTHLPLILLVLAGVLLFRATRRRRRAAERGWRGASYARGLRHG